MTARQCVNESYSFEGKKGWDVHVPVKSNRHILNVSENLTGRKNEMTTRNIVANYIYIYIKKNA